MESSMAECSVQTTVASKDKLMVVTMAARKVVAMVARRVVSTAVK